VKGARTRSPSRCGLVLVYEPAQDVAADEASSAVLRSSAIGPFGRLELQAAVRPVRVVVGGVDAYDAFERDTCFVNIVRPHRTPWPPFPQRALMGKPAGEATDRNKCTPSPSVAASFEACLLLRSKGRIKMSTKGRVSCDGDSFWRSHIESRADFCDKLCPPGSKGPSPRGRPRPRGPARTRGRSRPSRALPGCSAHGARFRVRCTGDLLPRPG
jgi:hypothetical protein